MFIEDETHYALERAGWLWSGGNFFKDRRHLNDNQYQQARLATIEALVGHALDFFKSIKEASSGQAYYEGSLRASLKPKRIPS